MNRDEAYRFLYNMAEGLAAMFGQTCETLVHDMGGEELVNLAVFNGHVTGRESGSRLGIYGNPTRLDEQSPGTEPGGGHANSLVVLPSGKLVKAATFHLRGADYHYALGVNYDVTVMAQMKQVLESVTSHGNALDISLSGHSEPRLEALFDACLDVVNKPVQKLGKEDRLTLVRLLRERDAFRFRNSVPYVAGRLGVSKYTVYKYLHQLA